MLTGKDVVGQAQTGTGKTAAFGIPLMERLDAGMNSVQGLVLVPTRELALQVSGELRKLATYTGHRVVTLYGGQPIVKQFAQLSPMPQIIVGTPGRVLDHLGPWDTPVGQRESGGAGRGRRDARYRLCAGYGAHLEAYPKVPADHIILSNHAAVHRAHDPTLPAGPGEGADCAGTSHGAGNRPGVLRSCGAGQAGRAVHLTGRVGRASACTDLLSDAGRSRPRDAQPEPQGLQSAGHPRRG